ncbi:MAG: hypothetical protein ABSG68_27055 [Thermoguttaceae bacterium]|jgi:protein ImuA
MRSQQCYQLTKLEALRQEIAQLQGISRPNGLPPIPSGFAALDQLLPERGFRAGTLVEWLASGEGSGAATLALATARQATAEEGVLVIVDRDGDFYPLAAARLGIDLKRLIVVHVSNQADQQWAADQALRCPAVAAMMMWPGSGLGKGQLDGRTFRRLQLAAEEGGSLGLLIRPAAVQEEPSWADVRLLVQPLPADTARNGQSQWRPRVRIVLLRGPGGSTGRDVVLEIDT